MPAHRSDHGAPPPLPDPVTRPTISVEEAGRLLNLSRASAYQAAHRGEIPVIRIGRRMLVPTAELLKMLGLGGRQDEGSA